MDHASVAAFSGTQRRNIWGRKMSTPGTDFSASDVSAFGGFAAPVCGSASDGQYLYVLSGNNLVIVNAWPAAQLNIVSATQDDGSLLNTHVGRHIQSRGDNAVVSSQAPGIQAGSDSEKHEHVQRQGG
jgi:hypothetical protein